MKIGWYRWAVAPIIFFIASISINCSQEKKESGSLTLYPWESPIVFQPNGNRKQPCRPVYYGMGDGDGVLDPPCHELQRQLIDAASAGQIAKIEELLRNGANATATAGDSISPLQWAATNGHLDAALLLLNNRANVNHYHPISGTPLSSAIRGGHADIVELLLSRGANPTLDMDGGNAFIAAKEKNNQKIIALLETVRGKKIADW
jgi:hypothetical protein